MLTYLNINAKDYKLFKKKISAEFHYILVLTASETGDEDVLASHALQLQPGYLLFLCVDK